MVAKWKLHIVHLCDTYSLDKWSAKKWNLVDDQWKFCMYSGYDDCIATYAVCRYQWVCCWRCGWRMQFAWHVQWCGATGQFHVCLRSRLPSQHSWHRLWTYAIDTPPCLTLVLSAYIHLQFCIHCQCKIFRYSNVKLHMQNCFGLWSLCELTSWSSSNICSAPITYYE